MSKRAANTTAQEFKEWAKLDYMTDTIPSLNPGDRLDFFYEDDKSYYMTGYVSESTPGCITLQDANGNLIGTLTVAEYRRECEVCWEMEEDDAHEERTCDGWITFYSLKYTKPENGEEYQALNPELTNIP